MQEIGLIDVDGHHFPNLALMRISAYHKSCGDHVEWWEHDFKYYDKIYMSKVFSDSYSQAVQDPINCGELIKGGTGFCISLDENGKEVFDKSKNKKLPDEVERMFPDYSIYPQYDFAVSMTSRGCPRGCSFCHVASKEGRCSVKVADVSDFWNGQKKIKILDPNITACKQKRELMQQYLETGALLDFTQGIDIRMIDDADIADLQKMRLENLHFAWDNANDDLEEKFRQFAKARIKTSGNYGCGTVYVLTNYNSTMEQNLYRIYTLRDLGYYPYVMIYNKPDAPKEIRRLQRWCNNRIIFKSVKNFADYK